MKILVPIKRVPDPQTNIVVKPDGSGIIEDNVKFVINPFCEIALEEALRIKEAQGEGEVVLHLHWKVDGLDRAAPHRRSRWEPIAPSS